MPCRSRYIWSLIPLAGLLVFMPAGSARADDAPAGLTVFDLQPSLRLAGNDLDQRRTIWDQQQLLAGLQGLVNRDRPRLYALVVGHDAKIDRYWLERLREKGQWLAACPLHPQSDLIQLVKQYREFIRGAAVWDERVPATALVASTAAGVDNLLPVRYDPRPNSLYYRLIEAADGPRLEVKLRLLNADGSPTFTGKRSGSAKCDAILWAVDHYLKTHECDPRHLAYYPDAWWLTGKAHVPPVNNLLCNHDYFIAKRAFFFDLGPWDDEAPDDDRGQPPGTDAKTLLAVLSAAQKAAQAGIIHVGGFTPWDQKYTDHTGGRHGGVPTEWRYAEILSCYNAYMDADAPDLNAMANASVFQHYPLAEHYPQKSLPTEAELKAKGYIDSAGKVAARNFASIYVGDYDSAAWLYQKIPEIWDDPNRGQVPLGWAFNPALAQRFPVGLAYARATATANDTFIAGDSGFGYLNPGYLVPPRHWSGLPSGLGAWEKLCSEGYRRWDLRVTGFVIDGNAPAMSNAVQAAYARFSPGGVVAQKIPEQSLVHGVPCLRMSSDLPDPQQGARLIVAAFSPGRSSPDFGIFRSILWTPTMHKQMFDAVRQQRPDIEFVEPHTLLELLRRRLLEQRLAVH
ncbi:MAG: GxGYxYP domain-containing protein [Thermoguttaceae bacterium]|jgi:hypothetical protein